MVSVARVADGPAAVPAPSRPTTIGVEVHPTDPPLRFRDRATNRYVYGGAMSAGVGMVADIRKTCRFKKRFVAEYCGIDLCAYSNNLIHELPMKRLAISQFPMI